MDKEVKGNVFIVGLLHDMGKIVLSTLSSGELERIKIISEELKVKSDFLKSWINGINHAWIGGMIADMWNFPEFLIESITYHHEPRKTRDDYKAVVYSVYLANEISQPEKEVKDYCGLDGDVLSFFKIGSEKDYTKLKTQLLDKYKDISKN